ncbi:MAG: thymidine kinase [Leptolyngbya sp. PLA1]|nr:thymidine kinase [Leptolyngbya sp. PLA1]
MEHPTLEAVCGPMFAGKTSKLIDRIDQAQRSGVPVVACRPAADTRSDPDALTAHDGLRRPAIVVAHAGEIPGLGSAPGGLVVIDEAHFFGDGLIDPVRLLLRRGVSVVVGGVDTDHRGRPFPPFPWLLCEADRVVKVRGVCADCGGPSARSHRLSADESALAVGGAESYRALCRGCFDRATASRALH